jgi:DNA-binding MarR family transcriptional regulator
VTAPTLTGRAIEPLIERGWVRRKRSEEDRRQYILELTASGQRMREKVEEARDGLVEPVGQVLDAKDIEDLDRIVKKVLAAFADAEAPPAKL